MEGLDPRQELFLANYLNPKSETFSNAYKSALKAGYSDEYATNILNKDTLWLAENVERRKRILDKAERNLDKLLDSEDEKIQADISKFTTKTLGKEHYSDRTELTGKDGEALKIEVIQYGNDTHSTSIPAEGLPAGTPSESEAV